jgi:DNA modification methylase
MTTFPIHLINEHPLTEKLYGRFDSTLNVDDFDLLKSIEKHGITEPIIITSDYFVISGNRRLKAAKMLGNITLVNVIQEEILYSELDELTIIAHQQQRVKDVIAVTWEFERLTELYNIGSGRTVNEEDLKKRNAILKKNKTSRKTIGRVKEARNLYVKLNNCSEDEAWEFLRTQVRELGKEPNTILEELKREEIKNNNKNRFTPLAEFKNEWIRIHRRSNEDLRDIIEDRTIDCSVSSPPYFGAVRKYLEDEKTGKKQKGHERTAKEYIESQMRSYAEVIRTLKDTGSIWINIADTFRDGHLHRVPEKLADAMEERGLKLKQKIIWVKNNPVYQSWGTFQASYEEILHFVKDEKQYKWNADWLDEADDFLGKVTYGAKTKKRQFRNMMFYPMSEGGVLETNVNHSHPLKKLLASKGIKLNHSAMFPYEVPMICILSTADKGDHILDNYHGMGTTALVAYAYDCHYVGVEYSTEYAEASVARIEDFIETLKNI